MTHEEFSQLLSKSGSRQRNMAIFILIVGIIFLGIIPAAPDNIKLGGIIFMGVLSGLCVLGGVALIRKATQTRSQVKNGQHPLLNAIQNGDGDYVEWFYEEIVTVKNVDATAAHQIWIHDRHNKFITLSVKGTQAQGILEYLQQHFPEALVGYSDENKKRHKQRRA